VAVGVSVGVAVGGSGVSVGVAVGVSVGVAVGGSGVSVGVAVGVAVAPTVVTVLAVLLERSGSAVSLPTCTVVVKGVPSDRLAGTPSVSGSVAEVVAGNVATVQEIGPVSSTAGVLHDQPAGIPIAWNVVLAGIV
jgi:hypothetical protein